MRQAPKQAVEWALDYHISNLVREIGQKKDLVRMAKSEFKEITGFDPKTYVMEHVIQKLSQELDYYKDVRDKIIELPRCDEPAFEVRE